MCAMDDGTAPPTECAEHAAKESKQTVVDSAQGSEPSVLEARGDDDSEADSALGEDNASATTSLASTILRHREEHGRTYHSYLESVNYVLPNDPTEQGRLGTCVLCLTLFNLRDAPHLLTERPDLQHHLFFLTQGDEIYQAPIKQHGNLQRILDAGTGTGIWAIDIGEEFPEAEVVGVDLSPIQPRWVPSNVSFLLDDLEADWIYSKPFDYVFGRMLVGSIGNWPKFISQSFQNLAPGGWLELQDIVLKPQCIDDTLKADSYIRKWSDAMLDATRRINRFADSGLRYKQQMMDAGFINVTEKVYSWPTNPWPKEPYRELGLWCFENIASQLEGLSMALFTRQLEWSPEEVTLFLINVRKEMADQSVHAWWPVHVVYGQKP